MDKYHKFFGSKLNSVLLLVLIVLMIFALRIMMQNKELYFGGVVKENVPEQIQIDEDNKTPEKINETIKPKLTMDQKINFLKGLIVKYPNSVIKECDVGGKKYFVSDGQAFDGLAVFYSDSGVELESCGGMKPSVPPYASMCETVMPSCKIIYAGGGSGYDNVDTYNLN